MDEQNGSTAWERQRMYWLNRDPQPVVRNSLIELLSRRGQQVSIPSLAKHEWTLPKRVSDDILRVCNNSDLSLYILLVSMFKAVAARCTGEAAVTILSPSYHQDGVIPGTNIVMFQDKVQFSEDIRNNILETRRTVVGAYSNQAITLAEIHGPRLAEEIVRNNPFCVSSNIHSPDTNVPLSPLELRFTQSGRNISCAVFYDSARLQADLVGEFSSNLEQFIEAASSDYTVTLEAVDWLQGERLEEVLAFSRGPVVDTPDASLHELFAEQVKKTPDTNALVHGARTVTYIELNAMADVAAQNLEDMGVEPGDTIGLRLCAGIDRVTMMLAALKTGAAFAPISPNEPPNRLSRLFEKSRPKLIVTAQAQYDVFVDVRVVEMSRLLEPRDPALVERAASDTPVDAPAYVIFTSGTTGEPKAVIVEHRGIVNAVMWKIREYAFSTDHRVLPLFGYEFDGFVLNVFAPLCSGATVILIDDEERRFPKRIAACIDSQRVTELVVAPFLYYRVLDHVTRNQLRSLQRVTLAGEAADLKTLDRSKRVGPHVRVSNEYGPTEGSVVSTYRKDVAPDSVRVIGTPIDNVNVYIFDSRGSLVPPGVVGEIFLGGRGLARGYAAGNAITQESFIHSQGERLYQTGDLGCWLPEGCIEFRGRRDGHIKVLGQRVDLEEIRSVILRHDGVKDAFVLCTGDSTQRMLCCCVVSDSPTSLDGIETFLRRELPPHMIPNRFVALESLPLNAGGKVDVPALHEELRQVTTAEEGGLPSNDIERRLYQIWRKVLQAEHFGVDDSFFSLGGHSLKAVRLLTDIHEIFGVELRLNQFFSANTVRRLAEIISMQLCEHPEARSHPPSAGTGSIDCALSSAQERMLTLANEHSVSYNLPILFSLNANLDVSRLQSALQEVLEQHDSLRASFHVVDGRWVQRFNDTVAVTISEVALTGDADIEDVVRSTLAPFNLEMAPLFRVVLFLVQDRHAYLLFDFHHIIVDEVSLTIILRELAMYYNGEYTDLASPRSYAAYTRAQQRKRASEDYRAQLAAATDKLSGGDLEPLRLPFNYPPPRRRSHSGGLVRREFSKDVIAAVRQICVDSEVTDFMFFMAAFGLLLNRYTQQSTFVIGAPVSLRSDVATRDLVGLCLNTVPFKLAIPNEATFREYLKGVAAEIIDDLDTSQVEFDDIVKTLRPERQIGENPLFSVMLNMVDTGVMKLSLNDVGATYLPIHNGASKFDLTLELDLAENKSSFSLEFAIERFRESTIQRLGDNLMTLLEDVVARPDAPISDLKFLNPAERERLLEWSGCKDIVTYSEGCVASLFERRVLERPSDVALVSGDDTMSYGVLNAKSNRLAHKLRSVGCVEDDVVAVFCERSPAAIIAIMAVQKAGAAHLPLDPFYPATRTGKMLSDSGARVLITDQDVSALHFTGIVLRTDADLSMFPSTNLGVSRRPESLAYVIYTSGTTGGAKGVMVAQRNLLTLIHRAMSQLAVDHRDVWTLFHSFCFDVSVWEMFGVLLSGSRLVIVPREIAADPDQVLSLIEKERVTVLCQPPSAFYLLADTMVRAERPTSIRYVVLAGEAVKTENLKEWYDRYTAKLVNAYGITETTIYSTFKEITGEEILQRTGNIGRPLPGTYVHILDPDLRPCPIGVIGELHIGGLGVGCGYLGKPELTRSRFVDDPFKPGHLLYRSGDLVRWLPNGEIEYVCRADTQVKVRGYRVEIVEIEAQMTGYSAICESVVLAEAQGSTTQLIGFFTSSVQEDIAQLRSHLEDHLPDYMVPARLVQLDRIPVTPNGKVDRKQLLSASAIGLPKAKHPPRIALEKLLSKTWAGILGISEDEIGIDDSFFALGGDSIGANLVVRLLENLGLPVELLDLFENPELGALAEVILSRNPLGANNARATANERTAYWDEMAATKVTAFLGTNERNASAEGQLKTTVHVPLGDLRSALAAAEDTFQLREVLLTALVTSLRMWSGMGVYRVGLLEGLAGDGAGIDRDSSLLVAPVVIVVKDIYLGRENLASVRACIRRAESYRLPWNEVVANPAYAATIEGGILFHFRDVASPETTSPARSFDPSVKEEQSFVPSTVPSGCMVVDCCSSESDFALTFTVPAGATDTERLNFLAEAFKFSFRETLNALPMAPSPHQNAKISLEVQPFSDVFFRDCTHQAVVTAVRYFGRDVHPLLANTTAVCVRDVGRSRGLRVCMRYLERQALDEVLVEAGISVHRSGGSADVCEDLLQCLLQGALGIVKVDCFFVKRHRDLFQKKHGEHTILICGYDRDRRLFEIIDNEAAGDIRYRRTTIGFDELRDAYKGYQRTFNPSGVEISTLTVSAEPGRHRHQRDETAIQREVIETLRLAHGWRDEEQAALALLYDDFCAASASEHLLLKYVQQLSFTFGELISAKRLLSYQVGRILRHSQLAQLVDEMIARLEIVYGLLTKLRVSQRYASTKVLKMQKEIAETRTIYLDYSESVSTFLEVA